MDLYSKALNSDLLRSTQVSSIGKQHKNSRKLTVKRRDSSKTLEKAIHCVILERKQRKKEMYVFLRSYRATPRRSTGVPQATVLVNRTIRRTLPKDNEATKSDRNMNEADARAKSPKKQYAVKRAKAKYSKISKIVCLDTKCVYEVWRLVFGNVIKVT